MKELILTIFACANISLVLAQSVAQAQTPLEKYLQQNNLQAQITEDGLHYVIQKPGAGLFAKEGNYALIRFKAMLLDSTVFDQSNDDEPFIFQIGNHEIVKGLDKGIRLMKKGGQATFYMPPSLGYKDLGVGKVVPPNSPLIYEVELVDLMDFEQYDKFMRALEEKERRTFEEREKAQFQQDLRIINDYAADNKLKMKRTSSGLGYAITKAGKGEAAQKGKRLKVAYEGYLVDGRSVDSSEQGKPYEFFLGQGKVLDGWEEGLQFFNEGAEGWLLIPSKLAYGPLAIDENDIHVPANSVLIFKIKLMKIL